MATRVWHYLQLSGIVDREFASALAKQVQLIAWEPLVSNVGAFGAEARDNETQLIDPPLRIRRFRLQRGYSRLPEIIGKRLAAKITAKLLGLSPAGSDAVLVCSAPYYAPVAEAWPGPVIYYLTDRISAYQGADPALVRSLDVRLCKVAAMVCPNTARLAEYLREEAACPADKIAIVPNATRACNILRGPLSAPASLPADAADLPRPVAGVIGNMASNLDWTLLAELIDATPQFSWLFVGPYDMPIAEGEDRSARAAVLSKDGRVRFVGVKPYRNLADYARAIDVAVLPYQRREPTFSGSPTRFYDHLASSRPMLATPAVAALREYAPYLQFFCSAAEGAQLLEKLCDNAFDDGGARERWLASRDQTWDTRAAAMVEALAHRSAPPVKITA